MNWFPQDGLLYCQLVSVSPLPGKKWAKKKEGQKNDLYVRMQKKIVIENQKMEIK